MIARLLGPSGSRPRGCLNFVWRPPITLQESWTRIHRDPLCPLAPLGETGCGVTEPQRGAPHASFTMLTQSAQLHVVQRPARDLPQGVHNIATSLTSSKHAREQQINLYSELHCPALHTALHHWGQRSAAAPHHAPRVLGIRRTLHTNRSWQPTRTYCDPTPDPGPGPLPPAAGPTRSESDRPEPGDVHSGRARTCPNAGTPALRSVKLGRPGARMHFSALLT